MFGLYSITLQMNKWLQGFCHIQMQHTSVSFLVILV